MLYKTFLLLLLPVAFVTSSPVSSFSNNNTFISYIADPRKMEIKIYWKDSTGQPLKSLGALKRYCGSRKEKLLFAMNGGMYKTDYSPLGLYIQEGRTVAPINTGKGEGNFYLQPNAVFYLTRDKTAGIISTQEFVDHGNIQYATQSGPMLLIDGAINSLFGQSSHHVNIRNGVGILPGNRILFAMSKREVNMYDFANFFKQSGCTDALYLDGFVSRTYCPEKNWYQTDGDFALMIAIVDHK